MASSNSNSTSSTSTSNNTTFNEVTVGVLGSHICKSQLWARLARKPHDVESVVQNSNVINVHNLFFNIIFDYILLC
jgi:hypothetical protein